MKKWNKRFDLQRMLASFMVLVIVLFVMQPAAFALESDTLSEDPASPVTIDSGNSDFVVSVTGEGTNPSDETGNGEVTNPSDETGNVEGDNPSDKTGNVE